MARRRVNTTKYEIIQKATELFLEKGYTATTPKMICDALDISTGNLTYYFPTKETLLAVLVELFCKFQSKTLQELVAEEGKTSLLAVCLEMATVVAISEEEMIIRDVFQSFYLNPLCLEYIRTNDTKRSKHIYAEFCPDWTDEQYIEAEILVSGIEYATLMTDPGVLPIEDRLTGALNNMMTIFNVPEEIRKQKIQKVLNTDYQTMAKDKLIEFKEFVAMSTDQILENLLKKDPADN